jgi:flavin reductase (DIM6/NTAB) family NADH-FMN oxidoreductase RutF
MLSESPPIVGVSSAPTHHTFRTIARSKTFSLSWLDRKYKGSVEKLASSGGRPGFDKLSSAGLSHHKGKRLRVPVPDVASAVLECKLLRTRRIGDHVLLLGQVVVAHSSEDFKDYWLFKEYRPILYTGWRRGLGIYD